MEVEKLSIRELMVQLRVGQFWGLLVVIVSLIVGAFALGYKANMYIAELQKQIVALEQGSQAFELQKAKSELDELNEKDRFHSLFLRYEIAKGNWFSPPISQSETAHVRLHPERFQEIQRRKMSVGMDAEEQWAEYRSARKAFDEYLLERMGKEKLKIKKGQKRLAVVHFKDGTHWDVPRELHATLRE